MKIEIWSDVICPFCYIGKRHLESALAKFPDQEVEIVWKSFQLNPEIPEKVDQNVYEYLAEVKGLSVEESKSMHANVERMAAAAGLNYNFDIAKVANSFNAHRVLQLAKRMNQGDTLKEALLKAYFTEGKDINDRKTLVEIAAVVGMTEEDVNLALSEDKFAQDVQKDIAESQQIGVRGVPFFVFDRKYGISGAQPIAHFEQTIQEVLGETQKETNSEASGEYCEPDGDC